MRSPIGLPALGLAFAVAACSSHTASPPMPQTGAAAAFIARVPAKHEVQKLLYVTDNTFSSGSFITTYRVDAKGNAKPVGVIKGYDTQLQGPNGIVVDARGEIYVADSSKNEILGFAPGSTGDAAPNVVITGSTLQQPGGLAIDAAGNLYTVSCGSDCGASGPDNVAVYPPGNAAPAAVISGSNTQFDRVSSVAVDAAGNIYVSNLFGNSIVVFPPGSNGNVAPIDVIAGSLTDLYQPNGVSVGPDGEIYTALNSQAVAAYHPLPYPMSNVPPDRLITGSETQLSNPDDPIVDASGEILVTNRYSNSIARFAPHANGNVAPKSEIAGNATQLEYPAYVYITTPQPSPSPPAPPRP
jgi:sugar lactone lactonase YvrE